MKVITLNYERTFNLGDYQSEKIGVSISLDSDDTPNDALKRARAFVEAGKTK
jgi:hypothetical protein